MATLTTVEGAQYYFDPKGIVAISDHDPSTGRAVTCVYGISTAYLHVAAPAQQFITGLTNAGEYKQLTRADGSPIWINTSAVTSIRSHVTTDPAGVNAVIVAGPITQSIKESADAAAAILQVPK
jgi:hypothetical protein